jgi:hypothetical protein
MRHKIINRVLYDGVIVLETSSAVEAYFYSQMREYNELTHEDAIKASNIAMVMYLKDDAPTPIGSLSDYVGKYFDKLDKMNNRWEMVQDFYDNYEAEDYEAVNLYSEEMVKKS